MNDATNYANVIAEEVADMQWRLKEIVEDVCSRVYEHPEENLRLMTKLILSTSEEVKEVYDKVVLLCYAEPKKM